MTGIVFFLRCFGCDETGAVTIEWVAVTSLALLLGIAAVYVIFSGGVGPLAGEVNGVTEQVGDLNPDSIPTIDLGN